MANYVHSDDCKNWIIVRETHYHTNVHLSVVCNCVDLIHHFILKISASADGGPRSWVCARLTLRSAPIDTSRNFSVHVSAE